jgi:UDP-N-acetylmuramate dehydrogenase
MKNPDAPHFLLPDDQVKLAAGWLLDQCKLKSFAKYGFQIYPENALVITNISPENTYKNLAEFREEIAKKVCEKFNIALEQEPEIL